MNVCHNKGFSLWNNLCQITSLFRAGRKIYRQALDCGWVIGCHASFNEYAGPDSKWLVGSKSEVGVEILGSERFVLDPNSADSIERSADQDRPPVLIGSGREPVDEVRAAP